MAAILGLACVTSITTVFTCDPQNQLNNSMFYWINQIAQLYIL
jgi:hypothetical protein